MDKETEYAKQITDIFVSAMDEEIDIPSVIQQMLGFCIIKRIGLRKQVENAVIKFASPEAWEYAGVKLGEEYSNESPNSNLMPNFLVGLLKGLGHQRSLEQRVDDFFYNTLERDVELFAQ